MAEKFGQGWDGQDHVAAPGSDAWDGQEVGRASDKGMAERSGIPALKQFRKSNADTVYVPEGKGAVPVMRRVTPLEEDIGRGRRSGDRWKRT